MPNEKTVRVRIAVGVNVEGNWDACGWDCKDADLVAHLEEAMQCSLGDNHTIYFVEATLPVPQPKEPETVEGEVVG